MMISKMPRAYSVLLVLLLLPAASVRAQTMVLEINDGTVTVNDRVFAKNDLPDDLDVEGVELRISIFDQSSINVEINGSFYSVTEKVIEPIDKPREVQVRIRNDSANDDGNWTYEITGGHIHTLSHGGHPDIGEMSIAIVGPAMDEMRMRIAEELDEWTSALDLANVTFRRVQDDASSAGSAKVVVVPHLQRMAEVMNYFSQMQAADHELYEEVQTEWDLEVEIVELAARIRRLQTGDERRRMERELRERLEEVFDMKQENRRREIEQLQLELQRLRERMMERNAVRERLIDARLKDLLQ